MPMSPQQMIAAITRNLPARTGRSLEQWAALVRREGPQELKPRIAWLRAAHGLGGTTAMVIAHAAAGTHPLADYEDGDALVDALYSGRRAGLRPLHDAAVAAARRLGGDVSVNPRKTYVALTRRRQFAVVQPVAAGRVLLGLVLPGVAAQGRLEPTRTTGSGRVTHRIALRGAKDLDAFARRWLREAYSRNG